MSNPMTEAVRAFRERVGHLVELAADDDQIAADVPDVIAREAAFLAEEGPAAYLRYVRMLAVAAHFGDPAAVRADLDHTLGKILEEGSA